MPATIENAESAYLMATARFRTWMTRFFREWSQPAVDAFVLTMWASQPEHVKAAMRQAQPEAVAEFEARLAKLGGG